MSFENPTSSADVHLVLEAVAFASRAHLGQTRKDGRTPYSSHPFRVCLILRHVFRVEDTRVLAAAVLHDTLEDTTADFDDLSAHFGADVASWVALLSKDSRLPEPQREHSYRAALRSAPWQVKVCKLADMYDNLVDSKHLQSEKRAKTFSKLKEYLTALGVDPASPASEPWQIVSSLLAGFTLGKTVPSDV